MSEKCIIESKRFEREDGQVVIVNNLIAGERHEHYPEFMGQGVVNINIGGNIIPETVLFPIEVDGLLDAFGDAWEQAIERKKNERLAQINEELARGRLYVPPPGAGMNGHH